MKKKWLIPVFTIIAVLMVTVGVFGGPADISRNVEQAWSDNVITLGTAYAAGDVDYTFDGVADDVQFQAALNALPATGGRLVCVSAVQVNFTATVSRAIDNVIIEGAGDGTYFVNNGVAAIFDAGTQDGWVFRNFRTDAGFIDVAAADDYIIENVTNNATLIGKTTRSSTLVVAASDASESSKAQADYLCDGTADDVQIQAAIDAATVTGGIVQLSEGIFNISVTIDMENDVWLRGAGKYSTIIKFINDLNDYGIENSGLGGGGNNNIILSDFTLDGNGANQSGGSPYGIIFKYLDYFELYNLYIKDCNSYGVVFHDGCTYFVFRDSTVENCKNNLVVLFGAVGDKTEYWLIDGVDTYGGALGVDDGGFVLNDSDVRYGSFVNCRNKDSVAGVGFYIPPDAEDIRIKNGYVENAGSNISVRDYGIRTKIEGGHYIGGAVQLEGNDGSILGNTVSDSVGAGIYLKSADGYSVIGNTTENSVSEGIWLYGSVNCDVIGNISKNNGSSGIKLSTNAGTDCESVIVSDNQCYDDDAGAQNYGLYLSGTCDDSIFENNILFGNVTKNFRDDSTGNVFMSYNENYIDSGETRYASGSLTAGNANAICFAWNNPEAQDILIKKVVIEVTTGGGTVGSHLDVGIADDAAGTNRGTEFFDDLLLNNVQINDSWAAGDGGTQTKWVFCQDTASATDGWIVGQILDANAASLVGKYYIEYVGR